MATRAETALYIGRIIGAEVGDLVVAAVGIAPRVLLASAVLLGLYVSTGAKLKKYWWTEAWNDGK